MFSKFFIDRPVFACVLSIIIVLAGLMGLRSLPVEEYPQLTPPQIVVQAVYNGADAQTITDTVATPLENAINGVEGMIYMQSTSSSAGLVQINVYFAIGTDPKTANVNVNNRVNQSLAMLPEEVKRVGVTVRERSSTMLEVLFLYDEHESMDLTELTNYVKLNVADELIRVDGVGDASVLGARDYSMRIWLKPDKLKQLSVTPAEVAAAIREQNNQYPAGKIGEAPMDGIDNPFVYSVVPEGRFKTTKEFENIIIRALEGGSFLRLKDLADVELAAQMYTVEGNLNAKAGVPIIINLQSGANALATAKNVKDKMESLKKNFPGSVTYSVAYDTTEFVKVSIKEVAKTFGEALLLVLLVMYLFLGNWRATIIPILAIPVSIIGTFGGLYLMGFSINLITLFAMILAIGIVVDDAIIVIENVERILEEEPHLSVKGATTKAMSEIVAPVISIVLVLCAVFVPVSFMGGFVGIIQKQFALTLVVSVMLSGLVALTLTPALCAIMLKKQRGKPFWFVRKFNEFFNKSTQIYSFGVSKILRHIFISLLCVLIMIFAIVALFRTLPTGLVPSEDKGSVLAVVSLPSAATFERTNQELTRMRDIFSQNKNIQNVTQIIGYDLLSGSLRENAAVLFLDLAPWEERVGASNSASSVAGNYNKSFFMDRNSQSFFMTPPPIMGLSITGGFDMYAQNINGKNYIQIEQDMHKLIENARKRPELNMVRTTLETNFPQYKLSLDRDKIKMLGINIADVFSTINMVVGQYYVNDFNILGKTFKVNLRAKSEFRDSAEDFRYLFVRSAKGELVPLTSVVKLTRFIGPDNVDRFNGFPAAKIMGEPASGYTSGQAINAISEVFKETLPDGYTIGWSGSAYQELESMGSGSTAFIFGLIFVYLILAAQYERWLMPAAVLTAVPFSVLGALVATWMRGLSNDIYFQIGLLLLIGLGAKNAILIVEFAMEERKNGSTIMDSAIQAAKMRFRPIIMTSLAFAFGVLPMVYSSGAGAASRHSLGTGVIGGMIAASSIAIFFVPMFFYLLESLNEKFSSKKQSKKLKSSGSENV